MQQGAIYRLAGLMSEEQAMTDVRFYDPRVGPYAGLSNLHPRPVSFDGAVYRTPEHAFQVAKARTTELKAWLATAPTPELVAAAGDALGLDETVPDWATLQLAVMRRIVHAKFAEAEDLRALLLSTGTAKIVEWAPEDGAVARFWGEYAGQGENWLGRLLMDERESWRGTSDNAQS